MDGRTPAGVVLFTGYFTSSPLIVKYDFTQLLASMYSLLHCKVEMFSRNPQVPSD
jgi:hypothetical protein